MPAVARHCQPVPVTPVLTVTNPCNNCHAPPAITVTPPNLQTQQGRGLAGCWKNPAYLKDLVEWIYEQPLNTWNIDVENYKENAQTVLDLYNKAKEYILKGNNHQAVTLVTKVLLGVFAIIPAYDRFLEIHLVI